ncbi:PREDICTED: pentatricopeptide repeat-containing protein At2g46050, mitochondrial-like [Camelina sativa]|uniref:Pentatricopeptide repeat-containing protein At2g46050, mitochondrial-like n=1 Tax=Camelina sativa TaxID=90675 RepID=A0ABM0YVT1_CAMSA|nr:PREDICTED: pentatricopeptide repeat-containing protein At2g46050, mitochondrial-like [Camelina sativa]
MRFTFRSAPIETLQFINCLFSLRTLRTLPSSSSIAISSVSKLSASLDHLFGGAKQHHGFMVKEGTYNSLFLQNKLLQAYTRSKHFDDADKLFDEMPVRDIVTWNILIHGVLHRDGDTNHRARLGFCYLSRILLSEVSLDHVSVIGLIRLCTDSNDVGAGIQLHCLIVKLGLESSCFLSTTLVDFYGKCGHVVESRRVFEAVLCRDLVLWNALVSSYVLNGMIDEAFGLLKLMGSDEDGFTGDDFTLSSLLSACRIEQGKQIHATVFKLSFQFDIPVATALVNMYAKSNYMSDARKCFESMVVRNVVSWNAMIVGFGQNGEGREVMRLFSQMFRGNVQPDELTFASVLSSCSKFSAIQEIKQVHAIVTKRGSADFLSVANALISSYSKTGNLSEALLCFHSIREPDLVSWTSVIGALASHGLPEESLRMFENMLQKLHPDKITFLEVLSACSHGGLVQEGLHWFKQMTNVYKIEPEAEHYTCLIDLLGRAGFIDEAFDVLKSMPIEPSTDALAAFTGACNIHEKIKSMKWGAKKLLEIEPSRPVNYSILSNAYASEGHWSQAAHLRKTERRNCNNPKTPGCSWLGDNLV